MNGAQDLGGMMGFGKVLSEIDEPLFHAAWEKRALAITLAMGATGSWTLDESRHARETLPPAEYLASSYYEIWIKGLTKLMLERGLANIKEVESGVMSEPPVKLKRVLSADAVAATLLAGSPYNRPVTRLARFQAGDRVVARNEHKITHTRLPRYVRGHTGTVIEAHSMFAFPDSNAHGLGEAPEWLYTVRFAGTELWGSATDPTLNVMLDLWESYLEPA